MKYAGIVLLLSFALMPLRAQERIQGPTNEKAKKTYAQASEYARKRMKVDALESFKKADKQYGGHCMACQISVVKYATELREWKAAEFAAQEMAANAQGDVPLAVAHYEFGVVLLKEGMDKHKGELFTRAHE